LATHLVFERAIYLVTHLVTHLVIYLVTHLMRHFEIHLLVHLVTHGVNHLVNEMMLGLGLDWTQGMMTVFEDLAIHLLSEVFC